MAIVQRHSSKAVIDAALYYNLDLSDVLCVAIARLQHCARRLSPLPGPGSKAQRFLPLIQRECDVSSAALFVIYCILHSCDPESSEGKDIAFSQDLRGDFRTINSVVLQLLGTLLRMAEGNNFGAMPIRAAEDCFTVIAGLLDVIPDTSFVLSALREGLVLSVTRGLEVGPNGTSSGRDSCFEEPSSKYIAKEISYSAPS